jgi:hypothetical protein
VHAPGDGWLLFPNPHADARQEWFYLARANPRFATASHAAPAGRPLP